jgi:L-serine dehydratase
VARVRAELYGSLGATGKGHGSDKAVLLGLAGRRAGHGRRRAIPALLAAIRAARRLRCWAAHAVAFAERDDLQFHRARRCPSTPTACASSPSTRRRELPTRTYYSVGGGFVVSDEVAADGSGAEGIAPDTTVLPHPFTAASELLAQCRAHGLTIAG